MGATKKKWRLTVTGEPEVLPGDEGRQNRNSTGGKRRFATVQSSTTAPSFQAFLDVFFPRTYAWLNRRLTCRSGVHHHGPQQVLYTYHRQHGNTNLVQCARRRAVFKGRPVRTPRAPHRARQPSVIARQTRTRCANWTTFALPWAARLMALELQLELQLSKAEQSRKLRSCASSARQLIPSGAGGQEGPLRMNNSKARYGDNNFAGR